ncbi:heterokaryon incompatibility 6 OR allele [Fusarium phyllophilum]|uniref:Heterokaryon incompatibility 6 OR allele n=1 Tax=Fusarium phyllophilum TaxID=47803 RepID=A0A8H5JE82_9HYPO|nr:heterokaryon incompatibility 6 OR allele [Fusarium phyllophilum]
MGRTSFVLRPKNAVADSEDLPYEYVPLGAGQVRLLRLDAGEEADQLNGELIVKSLEELPPRQKAGTAAQTDPIDPEKCVCFDAISYVWGQSTFTDTFFTPQGSIPITASLASILRRLRDEEKSHLYWADGLCINQSDMAEKEVQVSLMGIIYSSAIRVLCDIGEETENFTLILDAIERYWKRNIRRGLVLGQGDSMILSGESTARLLDIPYPTDEEADAIEDVEGDEWPARYLVFISAP